MDEDAINSHGWFHCSQACKYVGSPEDVEKHRSTCPDKIQRKILEAQRAANRIEYTEIHHLLQSECPADMTDDLDALIQAGTPPASLFTTVATWKAETAASAAPNQGP